MIGRRAFIRGVAYWRYYGTMLPTAHLLLRPLVPTDLIFMKKKRHGCCLSQYGVCRNSFPSNSTGCLFVFGRSVGVPLRRRRLILLIRFLRNRIGREREGRSTCPLSLPGGVCRLDKRRLHSVSMRCIFDGFETRAHLRLTDISVGNSEPQRA